MKSQTGNGNISASNLNKMLIFCRRNRELSLKILRGWMATLNVMYPAPYSKNWWDSKLEHKNVIDLSIIILANFN